MQQLIYDILTNRGGGSTRFHEQPDLSDSVPSDAQIEYEAMQKFKERHKAFYDGLR